jgi:hypothetical protein
MNDLPPLVSALLFVALIAIPIFGLFGLSIGWRTHVDPGTGVFVLRYSLPLRVFAVAAGFVVPLVLMLWALFGSFANPGDDGYVEIAAFCLELLGWLLLRETFSRRIVVSPTGLVSLHPWQRTRRVRWDEIVAVHCEGPKAWFVLVTSDRRRIEVPLTMAGLALLVDAMRGFLPAEVYAPAISGFGMAMRIRQQS